MKCCREGVWGGRSSPRNLRYPCLTPRGRSGRLRPLRNLRYLCLAPAPACLNFFWSEFFRRPFVVRPSVRRSSSVRPSVRRFDFERKKPPYENFAVGIRKLFSVASTDNFFFSNCRRWLRLLFVVACSAVLPGFRNN